MENILLQAEYLDIRMETSEKDTVPLSILLLFLFFNFCWKTMHVISKREVVALERDCQSAQATGDDGVFSPYDKRMSSHIREFAIVESISAVFNRRILTDCPKLLTE